MILPRHKILMLEGQVKLLAERCAALQELAYAPDGKEHRSMVFEYAAANERLRAAISRIDAINDNPAVFNSEINAVCDTILRPNLKQPSATESERA